MGANFRQSMAWLHTWFGLVLGFVLMVVFFFGSLSVFDREIDRWALPETRFAPQPMPSFEHVLRPALERLEPDAAEYAAQMPGLHDATKGPMTPRLALPPDEYWAYTTHRDPVLAIGAGFRVPQPVDAAAENHIHGDAAIDPRSGAALRDDALRIGTRFFYPLHYSLLWERMGIGYWIVGLAALAMLAALVSGVVIHRRLLRELFTFRPQRHLQRSTLDLHNLSGVVALPFHFFFAFTGLVIFAGSVYLPVAHTQLQPLHDRAAAADAARTGLPLQRAGAAAPLADVDAMVAEAKRRWAARDRAGEVGFLQIHHVGDANAYVSLYRAGSDRVALVGDGIHFDGPSGRVLHEDPPRGAASQLGEFLTGLHLQHFEHWLLRWLYVLGGLLGCTCIATGFLFFVEKRKRQHAKTGAGGLRWVDALAVTTVTGMLVATTAMLAANRLLPADLPAKGDWEQAAFWGAWALALVHAALRGRARAGAAAHPAWREQCLAIAGLAVAAVAGNALSTGDHLLKTVGGADWAVAGVDLALLATAATALGAARRLAQAERARRGRTPVDLATDSGPDAVIDHVTDIGTDSSTAAGTVRRPPLAGLARRAAER